MSGAAGMAQVGEPSNTMIPNCFLFSATSIDANEAKLGDDGAIAIAWLLEVRIGAGVGFLQ